MQDVDTKAEHEALYCVAGPVMSSRDSSRL